MNFKKIAEQALSTIKMKFGQIQSILKQIFVRCSWLNASKGKLVPSPFMILMKRQYNKIYPFLVVHIYHIGFSLIHPFKIMKH